MDNQLIDFTYVDLNEIDANPNFEPIPDSLQNVRVLKAEKKDYTLKKDRVNKQTGELIQAAGETSNYIKFDLAVVGGSYNGRRVFPSLFPGKFAYQTLRRIADRTGVVQEPGTPIEAWLQSLTEIQPTFKTKIEVRKDASGAPVDNNVDWRQVLPADAD